MTAILGSLVRKSGTIKEAFRELSSIAGGSAKLNIAAPLQEAALEERCILVDELDRPLGEASKRHCHLVDARGKVPLHRAFSVFLFDTKGNLLLQKRASTKVISRLFTLLRFSSNITFAYHSHTTKIEE